MIGSVRIGFLIFKDVEELDFVGPLEVFGMASRFGGAYRAHVVAEDREPIRCRNGLCVMPELSLADAPKLDVLVVPGGLGACTACESPAVVRFVRDHTGFSPRCARAR